ncbi:hypothetical protein LTR08_002158 [Meristemomyces frigidus]|nr:hypothetical protein LTR08_002158 [Meristemomyces frigidus]
MADPAVPAADEGISSLLDTDLYKLTMQCAVLNFFPDVRVEYSFTNRTPHMRLTRRAFRWLHAQITALGTLAVTDAELAWLAKTCPYLGPEYLHYLQHLRLHPAEQVTLAFTATGADTGDATPGDLDLRVHGNWAATILYEIPLLALTSEAYFKFVDTEWSHTSQTALAKAKGIALIRAGCLFSEFGTRRRRDRRTHELVMAGLVAAQREADAHNHNHNSKPAPPDATNTNTNTNTDTDTATAWPGKFTGTSNVHMAMRFGVAPVGTVAHEWFMAIAALTDDYARANERALEYWTRTFGRGVLAIALTDTFGTPAFLRAFARPAPKNTEAAAGEAESKTEGNGDGESEAEPKQPTYAQIFTGVRQDSGDPLEFIKLMQHFYASQGITSPKTIVFSDSLNVDKCILYKRACAATAQLAPAFGIGTFFTNDFVSASRSSAASASSASSNKEKDVEGGKSAPLNVVIKLSRAGGRQAVKLSDDRGKNTGEDALVARIKGEVGYTERTVWEEGDEAHRWDR